MIVALVGCGPVLPAGELAVGQQVRVLAEVEGFHQGFGEAVTLRPGGFCAGAPDAGVVRCFGVDGALVEELWGGEGFGSRMVALGERLLVLQPGVGVWEDARLIRGPATDFAVLSTGEIFATNIAEEAVAVGPEDQVLRTKCQTSCEVWLDDVMIGQTPTFSSVGFAGDQACWGNPQWEQGDNPGQVVCANDITKPGIEAEHLGVEVNAGWGTGVFTHRGHPPRGRFVHLSSDTVVSVERAEFQSSLAIDADEDHLLLGVPGYPGDQGHGQVLLVEAP